MAPFLEASNTESIPENLIRNNISFIDVSAINDDITIIDIKIDDVRIDGENVNGDDRPITKRKKREFSTKNLYELYCSHCDKITQKISGKKIANCKVCENQLEYHCLKCKRYYNTYMCIYLHLKYKCSIETKQGEVNNVAAVTPGKMNYPFNTRNLYRFYCSNCNKTITKIHGIKMMNCKDCLNRLKYECIKCNKRYNSFFGLYDHVKFKCSKQSEANNTETNLQVFKNEDRRFYDVEEKIKADIENSQLYPKCGETCIQDIYEHGQHEVLQLFQCCLCSFKSSHKSYLKRHLETEHKLAELTKDNFVSNDCDTEQNPQQIYSNGLNGNTYLYCEQCDEVISDVKLLTYKRYKCKKCKMHMLFVCIFCKRQYSNASTIINHQKYECNVQPSFECSKCEYKAKQKGNLQAHMKRKHTIKKCQGCGKKFSNYVFFRKHRFSKCGGKDCFKCRYCSFDCEYITQLKDHVRSEHKSRYTCKGCGKKYKNLASLKKHVIVVCSYDKKFECEHCIFSTQKKGTLVKHLRYNHLEFYALG